MAVWVLDLVSVVRAMVAMWRERIASVTLIATNQMTVVQIFKRHALSVRHILYIFARQDGIKAHIIT